MVILGGMGNVWGVCLGGALLSYLNYQGLEAVGNNLNNVAGTTFNIPQYTFGIFGVIIVAMMLVRPAGADTHRETQDRARGRRRGRVALRRRGVMAEDLLDGTGGAQGVRRARGLLGRRLHGSARAASSA